MVRDMTSGSTWKQILMFSIPVFIGNLFQQFYNMVDSIIVGRFVGTEAFAAVGSTGSITYFVLGLVFGACAGFAIPVAQAFGANDEKGVRRCVANIFYIGVAIAVVMTVVTTLLTRPILVVMDTPHELMQEAYDYLFWIFAGLSAQMLYNMLAGIMRALGDSRTPLLFLIISSILNILLDLLLICVFEMGTKGAAVATVISQLVSGLMCIVFMAKRFQILHMTRDDMRFRMTIIIQLVRVGLPMSLLFSTTAFGTVMIQQAVNRLGAEIVAANSAASRVMLLLVTPMDALGAAASTFAGQNRGAGKIERIRKGVWQIYGMLFVYSILGFALGQLASEQMARLFVRDAGPDLLANVKKYLFCVGVFFPALGVVHVLRSTLQGAGFTRAAMFSGVAELVSRALMGWLVVPVFGYTAVCFTQAAAWIASDLVLIPCYTVLIRRLQMRLEEKTVLEECFQ